MIFVRQKNKFFAVLSPYHYHHMVDLFAFVGSLRLGSFLMLENGIKGAFFLRQLVLFN
jgi:hypothetical protein